MKKILTLIALVFIISLFLGCSSGKENSSNTAGIISNDHLTKAINQVADRYGEPYPTIVKSSKTDTDGPTHKPMYIVFLKGNFSKGKLKAANLEFSILADGSNAWAIRAFDDNNRDVWLDNE